MVTSESIQSQDRAGEREQCPSPPPLVSERTAIRGTFVGALLRRQRRLTGSVSNSNAIVLSCACVGGRPGSLNRSLDPGDGPKATPGESRGQSDRGRPWHRARRVGARACGGSTWIRDVVVFETFWNPKRIGKSGPCVLLPQGWLGISARTNEGGVHVTT